MGLQFLALYGWRYYSSRRIVIVEPEIVTANVNAATGVGTAVLLVDVVALWQL